MTPAVLAACAVLAATARGALAASVVASGSAFKVSADRISGRGFLATPGVETDEENAGAGRPVLVVSAHEAQVRNLCVSVLVPLPVGQVTVRMTAGRSAPARATTLVVDTDQIEGDVRFTGVEAQIPGDRRGLVAQTTGLVMDHPKFTGWKGTAGSFRLRDVSVHLTPGAHECF